MTHETKIYSAREAEFIKEIMADYAEYIREQEYCPTHLTDPAEQIERMARYTEAYGNKIWALNLMRENSIIQMVKEFDKNV